jgi:hypothetical protein
MAEIYFGDFRVVVINHIKEIDATGPESHSPEWFLLRYLRRIVKNTEPPSLPGRVESSVRALIRFYLDNIDEKSELGDRCLRIYEDYRKTVMRYEDTGT